MIIWPESYLNCYVSILLPKLHYQGATCAAAGHVFQIIHSLDSGDSTRTVRTCNDFGLFNTCSLKISIYSNLF